MREGDKKARDQSTREGGCTTRISVHERARRPPGCFAREQRRSKSHGEDAGFRGGERAHMFVES